MKISELINSLQQQMQNHGDLDVMAYASYDGGYGYAGGHINDIKFQQDGSYPFIGLFNNDD